MGDVIIKLQKVTKQFGKQKVLHNISLDIHAGDILGIIGASGSGKTTLLNMIIGFLAPTKGIVDFRSPAISKLDEDNVAFRSIVENQRDVQRMFGFASQEPSFYPELSVEENLDLFGTLQDLSKDAKQTNTLILLKLMGLFEYRKKRADNLSGGMQKRLDLACAMVHDPRVLILDEPTADLDPHLRQQMWKLIQKINSKGTTVILSSHFLDELEDFCDNIAILHKGAFIHEGTPAELKRLISSHEEIHIQTLKGNYGALLKAFQPYKKYNITGSENKEHEVTIFSSNPHIVIERLLKILEKQNDVLIDLHVTRPTLNEVFERVIVEEKT